MPALVEAKRVAVTIVVNFPSYQKIVGLRTDNSEGMLVFVDGFVVPK
jgi:uncharacterized protein (DUF1330 family)